LPKVKQTGSDSIPRLGGSPLRKAKLVSDAEPEWEKAVERNQEDEEATRKEAEINKEATKIKAEISKEEICSKKTIIDKEVADHLEVETEEEVADEVDDQYQFN